MLLSPLGGPPMSSEAGVGLPSWLDPCLRGRRGPVVPSLSFRARPHAALQAKVSGTVNARRQRSADVTVAKNVVSPAEHTAVDGRAARACGATRTRRASGIWRNEREVGGLDVGADARGHARGPHARREGRDAEWQGSSERAGWAPVRAAGEAERPQTRERTCSLARAQCLAWIGSQRVTRARRRDESIKGREARQRVAQRPGGLPRLPAVGGRWPPVEWGAR